jgi:alpha-tubulin suppressor-like RCC1 family protein
MDHFMAEFVPLPVRALLSRRIGRGSSLVFGLAIVTGAVGCRSPTTSTSSFVCDHPGCDFPPPSPAVEVAPNAVLLAVGDTLRLTATPAHLSGSGPVTWQSLGPSIATISASGLVTSVTPGAVTVSATILGIVGLAAITVPESGQPSFSKVSGGEYHTCALTLAGVPYCWGWDAFANGQGGIGIIVAPVRLVGGLTLATLSAGSFHTCGLTVDATAYCWGDNSFGQLGDGTHESRTTPLGVMGSLSFSAISSGGFYTCGLTAGGDTYCWGDVDYDAGAGVFPVTNQPTAITVPDGATLVALSAGVGHVCGLTGSGQAYCWGSNKWGELGDGTRTNRISPVAVAGGLRFAKIGAGANHTCALTVGGTAYCWGSGSDAGNGAAAAAQLIPIPVAGGLTFADLSVGPWHTCGLGATGDAHCWGTNWDGELGDGTRTARTTPVEVVGGLHFTLLNAASSYTCGLTLTALAYCWGRNDSGALGDGTTIQRLTPVPVF